MGSNPINLGFRFILEMLALVIYGYCGWNASDGALGYLLALALPLLAAILWGTFAVLDDPSRSGKAPVPVSGILRLILELAFFGLAAYGLIITGREDFAWIFAAAVLAHYLLSFDRISWLLQQKVNSN